MPGLWGDHTPDSPLAPASHDAGALAPVSHPPSRARPIPVSEALPDVAWALPVLWSSRELPPGGGSPGLCAAGVALRAQWSLQSARDGLGASPAPIADVGPAHTRDRPHRLTGHAG
jgi:hypothetical protein